MISFGMTPAQIAEVCHEANRALQRQMGEIVNFPWENTAQSLRDSIIDGVIEAERGKTPEEMHKSWVRYKTEEGWTYGPVKDFASKTHPNLVPYKDLPEAQRLKDMVFVGIVRALS